MKVVVQGMHEKDARQELIDKVCKNIGGIAVNDQSAMLILRKIYHLIEFDIDRKVTGLNGARRYKILKGVIHRLMLNHGTRLSLYAGAILDVKVDKDCNVIDVFSVVEG